jgi:hypothetical protein
MDNTISWCVTDIFEYVIKFHNNTISILFKRDDFCLESTGESTQEIYRVPCNDVTT